MKGNDTATYEKQLFRFQVSDHVYNVVRMITVLIARSVAGSFTAYQIKLFFIEYYEIKE